MNIKTKPSAGFEPAIPLVKRPQSYAVDCSHRGRRWT